MPRRKQPPRLWLRPAERDARGVITRPARWIILDGGRHIPTGCVEAEAGAAAERLKDYIADRYAPARRARDIESIAVADVLSIYLDDCTARQANVKKAEARIGRLADWWGDRVLADVTAATCRAYAEHRGGDGGARRDLEDLRAAIRHHAKQGFHRGEVHVTLPEKGLPRDRWLTRAEAARLLWTCWRAREIQTAHRGPLKGQKIETDKRPLRHLARFILIALYTGTRAGAVATASPTAADGRSYVDLERGIFYRLAQGKRATNKRQPPVPIPPRLLAHMRRWSEREIARDYFVEWNGQPVRSVKTAMASACRRAGIEGVSPHTFRHTAATWLMQNGAPLWQAAGFLGMSEKTLRDVYGHHHPDHLGEAVAAITRRVSLPETLPAKRLAPGKAA